MKAFLTFVCLSMAFVLISGQNIDECLEQDSISCIQRSLYRKAKEFFNKDNIELIGGVSLVKNTNRNSKSGKEVMYDQEIEAANDITDRQSALENFVGEEVNNFLAGRSLRINFAPAIEKIGHTARTIVDSVPKEINDVVNEVVEGRGKKKFLKVIPLLLAAKAKLGLLATLGFFGIALLAKKAILVSLISLAVSGFIGLKNMWSNGGSVTPYNAGGWSAPNSNAGWAPPANNGGGWSAGSPGWDEASYTNQNTQFTGYH
ncbi:uncharacterized protein Osi6 [Chelonus insularis]|uniref:uncharacterized protein Osi6 n=1 Tax=Chelonus insularis TaxID=460826 RepID=UPI00158901FB|nr:uncharacterized protein LOC118073521 [Chelonus insularis]